MNKEKLCIIVAIIIFLIMIGTSTSVAEYVENTIKETGDSEYLGNVLMLGRISDKKFNGGYVGSYSFKIKCVLTYANQDPEFQWIENRVGWVCNRDYYGWIGNFFIFAKGDFYLIN
jgi:uncharacterized membrane protein